MIFRGIPYNLQFWGAVMWRAEKVYHTPCTMTLVGFIMCVLLQIQLTFMQRFSYRNLSALNNIIIFQIFYC